jgi:hypothetical protein
MATATVIDITTGLPLQAAGPLEPPLTITDLHAALVAACREQERVAATGDALPPGITSASKAYSEDMDAACADWWDVAKLLPNAPAATPAELRLKVDALRIVLEQCVCDEIGQTIDDLPEASEIEVVLAWSLARDILNFLGAV